MDEVEMEQSSFALLEELLNPRDQCTNFSSSLSDGCYFPEGWSVGAFDQATNGSVFDLVLPGDSSSVACYPNGCYYPLVDYAPFPGVETMLSNPGRDFGQGGGENGGELVCGYANEVQRMGTDVRKTSSGVGSGTGLSESERNVSTCKRSSGKKPSKNLMAERRRRQRLNDRLSMLRSIVPKRSKMDRTAIVADTIDYMKELLDRVRTLRDEGIIEDRDPINLEATTSRKELKPNVVPSRSPPLFLTNIHLFDVERRETDTRIQISCAPKPGLLLSTVSSMESLGLEIQQCVISCYSDFSLRASCFEAAEDQASSSPQDIMRTLIQNAGYGGRCL